MSPNDVRAGSEAAGRHGSVDSAVDYLEAYLHDHIPLTRAMGVSVEEADSSKVVLGAPLAPNINHRDTVFGGSASSLATLAAWSLVHIRMRAHDHSPQRIVIQRNQMEYLSPIAGDFTAESRPPDPEDWSRFVTMLERRGKARISIEADLRFGREVVGRFSGEFVAIGTGED